MASRMNASNSCDGIQDMQVYKVFGLAVPNEDNWEDRSTSWYVFFYTLLIAFGLLYVALGVACILLMWKRHLARRFKVNTFVAIDLALLTLGFSRAAFFVLDPWGQSGYFTCRGCVIVSRLLSALGFPSLTASYTLVFITLWLSAKIQLGRSCVQKLKVLIPLCLVHYAVAITFEIIGSLPVSKYPVVFLLVGCESVFTVWGFLICLAFVFAGHRLLRTVKKSAINSSVVCRDSPSVKRQDLVEKSRFQIRGSEARAKSQSKLKLKVREHHQRAIRKVTLITYVTATLGMVYSLVSFVNLTLLCLNLFKDCPGYYRSEEKLQPGAWLALKYVVFSLELLLALLLTYSITDYQPVIELLYKTCCGMMNLVNTRRSTPSPDLYTSSFHTDIPSGVEKDLKLSRETLDESFPVNNNDLETTIVVNGPETLTGHGQTEMK